MEKILLGDSLLEYMGESSEYKNYAIAGSTVNDVLHRLLEVDIEEKELYLLVGINDLLSGSSIDVLKASYYNLLENIMEQDPKRVHLVSLLPLGYGFYNSNLLNSFVVDFNDFLIKRGYEYSVEFIDVHSSLLCGKYLCDRYSEDGLHLSSEGYEIFKKQLFKKKEQ